MSLLLSGCGFTPVHQTRPNSAPLITLTDMDMPDTQNGRYLADALRGRWQLDGAASHRLSISIEETVREVQLNAAGVAARLALTYEVQSVLHTRATVSSKRFNFTHNESMARSNSGADDLTQKQNLSRLAMQNLAERLVMRLTQELAREPVQEPAQMLMEDAR